MLTSRKYNKNVIKAAIIKAKSVPREDTLKKVMKTKNERPVLAITYNPRLPSVSKIIKKHWNTMIKDPKAKNCFPKPPMIAFKQPDNLKRMLCHAKVPKNSHTKRKLLGMQACNKPCSVCPYIKTTKEVLSLKTKEKLPLKGLFTCTTTGVIYLISCSKCNQQYVGQTGRKFQERAKEHLYNMTQKTKTIGTHFSTNNHSHWDCKIQVIEKVMPNTPNYRLEREEFWIRKLETQEPNGMNKNI